MASWGRSSSLSRVMDPSRSIPVLVTNTPATGRLGAQAGSSRFISGPTLSRMRKWTQPQERRKARIGGDEGEARVEFEEKEEELVEELKGRKVKLPYRRASSLPLERLREVKRATAKRFVFSPSWGKDGGTDRPVSDRPNSCTLFFVDLH